MALICDHCGNQKARVGVVRQVAVRVATILDDYPNKAPGVEAKLDLCEGCFAKATEKAQRLVIDPRREALE